MVQIWYLHLDIYDVEKDGQVVFLPVPNLNDRKEEALNEGDQKSESWLERKEINQQKVQKVYLAVCRQVPIGSITHVNNGVIDVGR